MKNYILLTIIGLFIIVVSHGQDNRKNWSEGKLTWEDFQEKEESIGASELKYFVGYNKVKQKINDTTVLRIQAFCYVDKNISWVNKIFKNNQYLKYNQVIFDITELYRRKLQYELDRVSSIYEAEVRFNENFAKLNNQISRFQTESTDGQKQKVIDHWDVVIKKELEIHKNIQIPTFSKGNFGYAMHVGFGSGVFTGSLGEHFGQTFNFIYGFDFAYKKSILYLNATLSGGKVKKDYISTEKWNQGQQVNIAMINVSYGYTLIDKSKIKLSPFIGIGVTELLRRDKDNKDDVLKIVDYNFNFGLNVDYKIRKRIKLIPSFGVKESMETSIRTRLYITRVNYFDDLNGYSINLAIGICGFGNILTLKE